MGNWCARLTCCSCYGRPPCGGRRLRHVAATSDFYDEYFGHSFCYVRPDSAGGGGGFSSSAAAAAPAAVSSKVHHSEETTTFRTISGASLSANPSTQLSTAVLLVDPAGDGGAPASAAFESSTSFFAFALHPVPRFSGPLSGPIASTADRGFMSGPIERGFMSGPLDHRAALFSGPIEIPPSIPAQLRRSISHSFSRPRRLAAASSLLRGLTKAISRTISATVPADRSIKPPKVSALAEGGCRNLVHRGDRDSKEGVPIPRSDSPDSRAGNLEWAQGKAGEDRIHVVVSEEHGWLFVGIYDGFNGPDATDYLLSNLYFAVHRELKGLLWDDREDTFPQLLSKPLAAAPVYPAEFGCCKAGEQSNICDWQRENYNWGPEGRCKNREVNHSQVLKALSRALKKTEEDYLDVADKMISENPELALMGSCVLVMLLKGEDVYLMNVGDSRAILAQKTDSDFWSAVSAVKPKLDLHKINEDIASDVEVFYGCPNLSATQLTVEHSTCVEEVVNHLILHSPCPETRLSFSQTSLFRLSGSS